MISWLRTGPNSGLMISWLVSRPVHALISWLVARACKVIYWLASINLGKSWPDTRAHSWVSVLFPGPIHGSVGWLQGPYSYNSQLTVHRAHTCIGFLIPGPINKSADWFQGPHTWTDQSQYLYRPFDTWTYKRISWLISGSAYMYWSETIPLLAFWYLDLSTNQLTNFRVHILVLISCLGWLDLYD